MGEYGGTYGWGEPGGWQRNYSGSIILRTLCGAEQVITVPDTRQEIYKKAYCVDATRAISWSPDQLWPGNSQTYTVRSFKKTYTTGLYGYPVYLELDPYRDLTKAHQAALDLALVNKQEANTLREQLATAHGVQSDLRAKLDTLTERWVDQKATIGDYQQLTRENGEEQARLKQELTSLKSLAQNQALHITRLRNAARAVLSEFGYSV